MNLTDLKPKESKLKLSSIDRELTLRPISLSDEVWLLETYGQEQLTQVLETIDIKEISRIVYRLIKEDDKLIFKSKDVVFITESGESIEKKLGGLELLRHMVFGWDDKLALYYALIDNIGVSRPTPEKNNNEKKKKLEK